MQLMAHSLFLESANNMYSLLKIVEIAKMRILIWCFQNLRFFIAILKEADSASGSKF